MVYSPLFYSLTTQLLSFIWGNKKAQACLWWALCISAIGFTFLSVTWPDCIQQMFCSAAAGHSTTPNTHTQTHSRSERLPHSCAAWGPLCRKGATWGPKSSVGVGWLCNLIAWIVSFFFFVERFLFFYSFLALSRASYSHQTSTSPDITARLLGDNMIGWQTACEHITAPLNILMVL